MLCFDSFAANEFDTFKSLATRYESSLHKVRCDGNTELKNVVELQNSIKNRYDIPVMTLSLSCCKYPSLDSVVPLWQENLLPLMELLQGLATGIRASVSNVDGTPLRDATVQIDSTLPLHHVSKNMAYFKMILQPGNYTLTFSCEGYSPKSFSTVVGANEIKDLVVVLEKSAERKGVVEATLVGDVNKKLNDLNGKYPQISKLHTVGRFDNGETAMALEIGSQNQDTQLSGVPAILFLAGVEDNAPVTSDVLLNLAEELLKGYKKNTTIAQQLDKFAVYIAPSINPGETAKESCEPRKNSSIKFPVNNSLSSDANVVVKWLEYVNPILAVNLLTGSIHVEIPFGNEFGNSYETDDDALLKTLASTYAKYHPTMYSGKKTCEVRANTDEHGVTHSGVAFGRPKVDSLIDFAYLNTSALMINAYVACCNTDRSSDVWLQNKNSLLAMIGSIDQGLVGYVTDGNNQPVQNAEITYDGSAHRIRNGKTGAYWIMLPSGAHKVTAKAYGYTEDTKLITTPNLVKFVPLMFKLNKNQDVLGMPRIVFIILTGAWRQRQQRRGLIL